MNNQDIMTNYLSLLKSSVEVYVHGTLESSNSQNRSLLHDSLNSILDAQAMTFDEMVNNNFYNVQNVKESDIKKVYNKISK